MTNPLISVIIPVYNVEKYLRQCVDSVLAQTYQNLEIILVDDGSTDQSGQICDEYAGEDKRIKVIHQKNSGVSCARNVGLNVSKGEYIAFVDPDDYIFPDMYRTLLEAIVTNSADIALCKYQDVSVDGEVLPTESYIHHDFTYLTYEQWFKDLVMHTGVAGVIWNKLFTRRSIGKHRFDTKFVRAEDVNFVLDITQTHYHVTVCSQVFYNYVKRPNSAVCQRKIRHFENEYVVWDKIWHTARKLVNRNPSLDYLLQYIAQQEILRAYKLAVLIIILDNQHQYDARSLELEELFKENFSKRKQLSSPILRAWAYLFATYPRMLVRSLRMPVIRQCFRTYITHFR